MRLEAYDPRLPYRVEGSKVKVKAKQWFTAAAADQPAASTELILTIGSQCLHHAATDKID